MIYGSGSEKHKMKTLSIIVKIVLSIVFFLIGCDILSIKDGSGLAFSPNYAPALDRGSLPNGQDSSPNTQYSTPKIDAPMGSTQSSFFYGRASTDALFDRDAVPLVELTLPPERWKHLLDHALDEDYEPACMVFDGISLGTVGLRFKGAQGTLVDCVDKSTGTIICDKLSMKVKFNEINPNKRFHGVKRLNFNSLIKDPTKLRERLGYDLYRDMGIYAPRSSWAVLRVNGESYGLFAMVEQIDGRFTANRWPANGGGNLFKEAWPSTSRANFYQDRLKTNKNTGAPNTIMEFYYSLSAAAPEQRFTVLARWMDTDYLHRYMAVDDAIFNADGCTAFYSHSRANSTVNHNFYLYQEQHRNFFWMIPWDLDITFQFFGKWAVIPHWTRTPAQCAKLYPVWDDRLKVAAPGCNLIFQTLASNLDTYRKAVDTLLAGPFAEARILTKIDELAAFIDTAVKADPYVEYTSWRNEVAQMKTVIPLLRQRLKNLRDNKSILPFGIDPAVLNTFEDVENTGLRMGVRVMHNSASSATQSVSTVNPIDGLRNARLDFVFRDGLKPYGQWLFWSFPLAGGHHDLSGHTHLQFMASADRPRILRVELESPQNTNAMKGIRPGWDIKMTSTPKLYKLKLAEAKVPLCTTKQGIDPDNSLLSILSKLTGLAFHPLTDGRGPTGLFGKGITDSGFIQVDNIEFIKE